MYVEIIEHKKRADAIEAFKRIRSDEDVVGVEFLKAGKVLRVTRSGDAPDESTEHAEIVDETAPATEVMGELVESEPGTAVNAETGEETPVGQPLPVIEQTDGEPLTTEAIATVPDSSSE